MNAIRRLRYNNNNAIDTYFLQFVTIKEPRPHQVDAVNRLRESMQMGNRCPLLMAPTGFGKTFVARLITELVLRNGGKVVYVVDNYDLADQAYSEFSDLNVSIGFVMGGHPKDYSARIQIVTAHSLPQNMWVFNDTNLSFIDECHVNYKIYQQIPTKIIGLSATPWSNGLGLLYDDLIIVKTVKELIDDRYLCPFKAFSLDRPSLEKIKKRNGSPDPNEAAKRYTTAIMGNIVEEHLARCEGQHTIGFFCNVAHSKSMAQLFRDRGIRAIHVDGYRNVLKENDKSSKIRESKELKLKRKEIISRFRDREFQILCNVGIASKGFDCPSVSCIIDAQPTNSIMLKAQKFGRLLRIHPGKEFGTYLDFAGNLENWLPTDPVPQKLSMGEKTNIHIVPPKKEILSCENIVLTEAGFKGPCRSVVNRDTGICIQCNFDHLQKQKTCTRCGYKKEMPMHACMGCGYEPKKDPKVKYIDGELVEIIPTTTPKEWMRMLKTYENRKGKWNGYALSLYKKKFGCEPEVISPKTELDPSEECLNYIQSRNIAYGRTMAKRKNRASQ